jgi:hypothetical protein
MGIYPGKKVMSGRFGFDMAKVQEGLDSGKLDIASGVTGAMGAAISNLGKKDLGYGVSHQGVGAATAGGALSGAAMGFQVGKNFGVPGAIIGTGVGLVTGGAKGLINAKEEKKKALSQVKINMSDSINSASKNSKNQYASLGGFKHASYAQGGKFMNEDKAVIMGGKRHKDGGNPIVFAENGEKIAETEREELLLTYKQTSELESMIEKFDSSKSESVMVSLGKRIQEILLNDLCCKS